MSKCKSCGTPLPPDAPLGLCPRCLMGIGRRGKESAETSASSLDDDTGADRSAAPPAARETEVVGCMVGRYKLLQRIGEGGFGVVYMAEQREPVVRRVALKIIKAGMDTKQVITRFEAERQALALMDHPNIAKVLDGGATENGRPYFVMELVRGLPITLFCDREKFDTRQRLELFMDVCAAVQHAHQKGIIHRDLKPSNILVGIADGKPVAKVIDFGIAKATQQQLTDKTLFTQFGQFIGTPLYISPEQAEISAVDIDTRSDIYSLGVVLYELLIGRPPLDPKKLLAAGLDEMRRMIRETDALKPSTCFGTIDDEELACIAAARHTEPKKLGNFIKGDLDWIVLKALEKDRARRYETANAFREDLRRFLMDEPVTAVAPGSWYKFRKFARRKKGTLAAVCAVALALVGGTLVSAWQAIQARTARDGEAAARALSDQRMIEAGEARAAAQDRLELLARADWVVGRDHLLSGEDATLKAMAYLARSCDNDPSSTRAVETSVLAMNSLVPQHGLQTLLDRFRDRVASVDFSPDGRRLAAGRMILDSVTKEELATLDMEIGPADSETDREIIESRFSHDGTRVVTSTRSGRSVVWDSRSGAVISVMDEPEPNSVDWIGSPGRKAWATFRAEFDLTGKRVLTSGQSRWTIPNRGHAEWPAAARVWDAENGKILSTLIDRSVGVNHAGYSPDGRKIITASPDETVRVWDSGSFELLFTFTGHPGGASHAEIDPTGSLALSVAGDFKIRLWDLTTGRLLLTYDAHGTRVTAARFTPDGNHILSASSDHTFRLLRLVAVDANPRPQVAVFDHELSDEIADATISPDGAFIALASPKGQLWIVDRDSGRVQEQAKGVYPPIRFSPDGMRVVGMTMGKFLPRAGVVPNSGIIRDLHSRSLGAELHGDLTHLKWHIDGLLLHGIARRGSEVWTVDRNNKSILHRLTSKTGLFSDLHLSADSALLRSLEIRSGQADRALIRDAATGGTLAEILIGGSVRESILHASFSPDGTRIATVSGRPAKLRVWNADDGEMISCAASNVAPTTPTFSPDGTTVECSTEDARWALWDASTGKPVADGPGRFQEFAPDGNRYVTSHENIVSLRSLRESDKTLDMRIATSNSGESPETGALVQAVGARFSPDGRLIVTSSEDHTARLWNTSDGSLVRAIKLLRDGLESANFQPVNAVFNPDGTRLITQNTMIVRNRQQTGYATISSVWDLAGDSRMFAFQGMGPCEFSSDGRQIVYHGVSLDFMETMGDLDRVPSWWSRFLELFGNGRIDDSGLVKPLDDDLRKDIEEQVRHAIRNDRSRLAEIARWVLTPNGERAVGPWDRISPEVLADLLATPTAPVANLLLAHRLDPLNPLVLLGLAGRHESHRRLESGRAGLNRYRFLRSYAEKRLSNEPAARTRAAAILDEDYVSRYPGFEETFWNEFGPAYNSSRQIQEFLTNLAASGDPSRVATGVRFLMTLLDDPNHEPDWQDFFGFSGKNPGANALALGALLIAAGEREPYIKLCQRYSAAMDDSENAHIHRFVRLCMLPNFPTPRDIQDRAHKLGEKMIAENPDYGQGWGQLACALGRYRRGDFGPALDSSKKAEGLAPPGRFLAEIIRELSESKLGRNEDAGPALASIRNKLAEWRSRHPDSPDFHIASAVDYLLEEADDSGIEGKKQAE